MLQYERPQELQQAEMTRHPHVLLASIARAIRVSLQDQPSNAEGGDQAHLDSTYVTKLNQPLELIARWSMDSSVSSFPEHSMWDLPGRRCPCKYSETVELSWNMIGMQLDLLRSEDKKCMKNNH
jgi:hypothetical protein